MVRLVHLRGTAWDPAQQKPIPALSPANPGGLNAIPRDYHAESRNHTHPHQHRTNAAELASLYVLTAHHRKGVGRMLVEAGKHAIGNDRLVLWVMAFNANAQGFYRHIGFHETGHTQTEDMGPELEMVNYTDEPNQR